MSQRLTPTSVIAAGLMATALIAACGGDDGDGTELSFESSAREATASGETDPVPPGGDADDPAIWVHPDDPADSTIIGTDKLGGLAVYDLEGNEIQYLADGDLNNVDLRDGFRLGGESVTLVTAADATTNRLAIYRVDPATRELVDVTGREIELGIAAYGSCMYRSAETGRFYVFVNSEKDAGDPGGRVEQWELIEEPGGRVDARRVRSFAVGSQTEGCVADDELGDLYIGEEARGSGDTGLSQPPGPRGSGSTPPARAVTSRPRWRAWRSRTGPAGPGTWSPQVRGTTPSPSIGVKTTSTSRPSQSKGMTTSTPSKRRTG